jgi:hypothetical protein
MEFLSLANHSEPIRERTVAFGEKVRKLGLDRLEKLFRRPQLGGDVVSPFPVTMAISSVGSVLGLETAIGIAGGHKETRALIEWCIDQLEPDGGL